MSLYCMSCVCSEGVRTCKINKKKPKSVCRHVEIWHCLLKISITNDFLCAEIAIPLQAKIRITYTIFK